MLDIRYHIVSLVAVFLALGLGILIGTIVVQDPDLLQVQDNLIRELSDDLKALDAQNAQSRAMAAELEQTQRELVSFAEEVLPLLVSNRLFGRHIAVVSSRNPDMQECEREVRDILAASGASVRTVVLEQPVSDMLPVLQEAGFSFERTSNEEIATTSTARILVDFAIVGYDAILTPALLETECLSIDQVDDAVRADSAVIIAESVDLASAHMQAIKPLLDALAGRGTPAVVTSGSDGLPRLPQGDTGGVHAVYGVGTAPGKYRLIMALAGETRRATSN